MIWDCKTTIQIGQKILKRLKVDEDFNDWVRIELEIWKRSGKPSKDFKVFISQFLFSEDLVPKSILIRDNSEGLNELNSSFIKAFADKYFSIHEKIMLQEKLIMKKQEGYFQMPPLF